MKSGFYASTAKQELACPDMEIDQLLTIDRRDRTARTRNPRSNRWSFHEALEGQKSRIEAECATSDELRCDVVSLYHGGRYHLYKYRRFQDIRLVFAPEMAAAYFGGYPDNFMFPRSDLDVAFLRVYDGQVPLTSSEYFRWAASAPTSAGELTFVPGIPGTHPASSRSRNWKCYATRHYRRDSSICPGPWDADAYTVVPAPSRSATRAICSSASRIR
jgi:hypothetical protein